MWTRGQLKEKAKFDLHRSYWGLVLMSFIAGIVSGGGGGTGSSGGSSSTDTQQLTDSLKNGTGSVDWGLVAGIMIAVLMVVLVALIIGFALSIFLLNPLQIGTKRFFIEATYREKKASEAGLVAFAFGKGRYGNVVKTMFLKGLYQWLWSLLFIIPGIVKGYEYRMIPYILAENPEVEPSEAFELSKQMMSGEKWNAFVLDLSFLGWIILSIFTCGILALFYVNPYMYMTDAELYETLKRRVSSNYFDPTLAGIPTYGGYENNGYASGEINYPGDQSQY